MLMDSLGKLRTNVVRQDKEEAVKLIQKFLTKEGVNFQYLSEEHKRFGRDIGRLKEGYDSLSDIMGYKGHENLINSLGRIHHEQHAVLLGTGEMFLELSKKLIS